MIRKLNNTLFFSLVAILTFALLTQLANLIGFGDQEVFLKHPEYPEGEEFKKHLKFWKVVLFVTTSITGVLLTTTIFSIIKKNQSLFNWTSLITFFSLGVLPFIAFINGKTVTGILTTVLVFSGIMVTVFKINRESNKSKNI